MIDRDEPQRGTGYEELDWRLDTYAAARLDPSVDAVRRMRKAVVLRAADLAAIRQFEAERFAAEEERRRNSHRGLSGWLGVHRRASAALLAASMTFASVAAVFASPPGSALYPTRVWLQTVFLPAAGDARAAAHVDLLEQQVEDAEHAAGGGDPAGVQAALTAYIAELQSAIADAQSDPVRLAELEHALEVHLLLLQQLENNAPADTQNAIHQAINDNRKATHDLQGSNGGGGGTNGGGRPTPAPTVAPKPVPATPAVPDPTAVPDGGVNGGSGQNGDN
jgi:hypothetical protein